MKLSVVIPARDEEGTVEATLRVLGQTLSQANTPYEVIVVDDGSRDSTADIVLRLTDADPRIRIVRNAGPRGFGNAVRLGLRHFTGDAVAIMMATARTAHRTWSAITKSSFKAMSVSSGPASSLVPRWSTTRSTSSF